MKNRNLKIARALVRLARELVTGAFKTTFVKCYDASSFSDPKKDLAKKLYEYIRNRSKQDEDGYGNNQNFVFKTLGHSYFVAERSETDGRSGATYDCHLCEDINMIGGVANEQHSRKLGTLNAESSLEDCRSMVEKAF